MSAPAAPQGKLNFAEVIRRFFVSLFCRINGDVLSASGGETEIRETARTQSWEDNTRHHAIPATKGWLPGKGTTSEEVPL